MWKMEGSNQNENQKMQNEKTIMFINELKLKKKWKELKWKGGL